MISVYQPACLSVSKDKLKLREQNLGWVFNSRCGRACLCLAKILIIEQPNLKLKTRLRQLLGFLSLAFMLPTDHIMRSIWHKHQLIALFTWRPWESIISIVIKNAYCASHVLGINKVVLRPFVIMSKTLNILEMFLITKKCFWTDIWENIKMIKCVWEHFFVLFDYRCCKNARHPVIYKNGEINYCQAGTD